MGFDDLAEREEIPEDRSLDVRAKNLYRANQKRLYRALPRTKEWAEQNYYQLRAEDDVAERISPSAFWKSVAEGASLSPELLEAHRNLTEVLVALAISDLPFTAEPVVETRDDFALRLTATGPCLLVSEEVRPAEPSNDNRPLLLSQQFYRPDDRYRYEGNEQVEKFIDGEFIRRTVYGARVTLTNPTASRRRLDVLLQIPEGALPVHNGFYTDDRPELLEPYTTTKIDYFFYFPEAGLFEQFPVHAAADEKTVGKAEARRFDVVEAPTTVDKTSWKWVSQHASSEEVVAYLRAHNLRRLDLELMAWRLKDRAFYEAAVKVLEDGLLFHETTYRYAFRHRDAARAKVWLQNSALVNRVGPALDSTLLTVDPLAEKSYQHLEYDPLVNPRAHPVGAERKILNTALREQYRNFLRVQMYRNELSAQDRLGLVYYFALQDRMAEALEQFKRLDAGGLSERIQYDYLAAWLAMRELEPERALALAEPYLDHPVKRWRTRFQNLVNTVNQARGGEAERADDEDRQQDLDQLAAKEPSLELTVENGVVTLVAHNLERCTVSYYPMDIELLFSRKPFLAQDGSGFSMVKPVQSHILAVRKPGEPQVVELPEALRGRNLMIEVAAAGLQQSQVYFANRLHVRMMENYGQLEVRDAESDTLLPKTYVKVYARLRNGSEVFWKDGYTDLRGRFDYVSLNDRNPNEIDELAMLILSETHGALIREAKPPKQ